MDTISTSVISNDTLSFTFNILWRQYDTDEDNRINFEEFSDFANGSVARIMRGFITRDNIWSVYRKIADGDSISRDQMAGFILSETGIDIESQADRKIEAVIDEHNEKVEQHENKTHKKSWLELVAEGVNSQSSQYHEAVKENRKKNKKMGFWESVGYMSMP